MNEELREKIACLISKPFRKPLKSEYEIADSILAFIKRVELPENPFVKKDQQGWETPHWGAVEAYKALLAKQNPNGLYTVEGGQNAKT